MVFVGRRRLGIVRGPSRATCRSQAPPKGPAYAGVGPLRRFLMGAFTPIRKLAGDDEVKSFDCGQVDLNEWLSRYAYANQRSGMATVFVTTPVDRQQVVGYYALATGG